MHLVTRLPMTQRPQSVEHRSFTGVEALTCTSQPLQPTRSFTYSALQAPSRIHATTSTKFFNAMPRHPNTRQTQERGARGQAAQGAHCRRTLIPSKKACTRPCNQLEPTENPYRKGKKSWTVSELPSYACAR